jgi:hypothetical protein
MQKDRIQQLINEGFKIKVFIAPNKKYDGVKLNTVLFSEDSNVVYPVYYNHIKEFLNPEQLVFIDTYNTVKKWTFREDVEMNIKFKGLTETKEDIQNRIVRKAIKKLEYLEQL